MFDDCPESLPDAPPGLDFETVGALLSVLAATFRPDDVIGVVAALSTKASEVGRQDRNRDAGARAREVSESAVDSTSVFRLEVMETVPVALIMLVSESWLVAVA